MLSDRHIVRHPRSLGRSLHAGARSSRPRAWWTRLRCRGTFWTSWQSSSSRHTRRATRSPRTQYTSQGESPPLENVCQWRGSSTGSTERSGLQVFHSNVSTSVTIGIYGLCCQMLADGVRAGPGGLQYSSLTPPFLISPLTFLYREDKKKKKYFDNDSDSGKE